MIHLLGKFSTNSDLYPIPKEKMIDENCVQVENKSYMAVIFDDTGFINVQMVTKCENTNQAG